MRAIALFRTGRALWRCRDRTRGVLSAARESVDNPLCVGSHAMLHYQLVSFLPSP
jgi:hypothetical protein